MHIRLTQICHSHFNALFLLTPIHKHTQICITSWLANNLQSLYSKSSVAAHMHPHTSTDSSSITLKLANE